MIISVGCCTPTPIQKEYIEQKNISRVCVALHECYHTNALTKMVGRGISQAEYRCMDCGYVTIAGVVPEACPVCKHKKTFENVKD